jgi:hypothetical protein
VNASTPRGIGYGIFSGLGVALVYGLLAGLFELSGFSRLGLLVLGFASGWIIGNSIAYGTWRGREHAPQTWLRWLAVAISLLAWVGALFVAYFMSQALLPSASTPLGSRLSLDGFINWLSPTDSTRFIDYIALALMAVMAWRGAR